MLIVARVGAQDAPPLPPPFEVVTEERPDLTFSDASVRMQDAYTVALLSLDPPSKVVEQWKESADTEAFVTYSIHPEYTLLNTNVFVEGTAAFHLAHPPTPVEDQVIILDPAIDVQPSTFLFFESRLGWASENQTAWVEVSTNNGALWSPLWSRSGSGDQGQTTFQRKVLSLSDYVGHVVRIRFVYGIAEGSYYPGNASNLGWLIDDIQVGEEYRIDPVLYSIGQPTGDEQQNLEFINRARASAAEEAIRLRDTDDEDVIASKSFFDVDDNLMVEQFLELPPSLPPLAFNKRLLEAARLHSQDMLQHAFQGHTSSHDPPLPNQPGDSMGDRLQRQGYVYYTASENVFAYAYSVWHGHAAFNVNWGSAEGGAIGGMQNPAGHRGAIHSPAFREVGLGLLHGEETDVVGPMVFTQKFGTESGRDQPFLTGVAWVDLDGAGFYSPGEGLEGMSVTVDGNRYKALTSSSGGYAIPLPGNGEYKVRFRKPGYPSMMSTLSVTNGQNVKLDYQLDLLPLLKLHAVPDPHEEVLFRLSFSSYSGSVHRVQASMDFEQWSEIPSLEPDYLGEGLFSVEIPTNMSGFVSFRVLVELESDDALLEE